MTEPAPRFPTSLGTSDADSITVLGGVFNGSPIPFDSPNTTVSNPHGVSFPLDTGTLAIAELQYEAVVVYRETFPPIIVDDLLRIHQETVPLRHDGTIAPIDEVLRIINEYEFTPAAAVKAAA